MLKFVTTIREDSPNLNRTVKVNDKTFERIKSLFPDSALYEFHIEQSGYDGYVCTCISSRAKPLLEYTDGFVTRMDSPIRSSIECRNDNDLRAYFLNSGIFTTGRYFNNVFNHLHPYGTIGVLVIRTK